MELLKSTREQNTKNSNQISQRGKTRKEFCNLVNPFLLMKQQMHKIMKELFQFQM